MSNGDRESDIGMNLEWNDGEYLHSITTLTGLAKITYNIRVGGFELGPGKYTD